MTFELPSDVKIILSKLEEKGYRADIVGGCVRDHILGAVPSDYDITTSARPEQIKEVFSDMRVLDIGIKHGTITVILNDNPYEITTYRTESEYLDHRHPSRVDFTDKLSDDLGRRDFTMNAIAYNTKHGITDIFCGREDIEAKIVRAVGDPRERFFEDALRILRAVRFSSVLGFTIEDETARAAVEMSHLISSVSGERIAVEWKKTLAGVGAYNVITENASVLTSFLAVKEVKLPTRVKFENLSPQLRELSLFYLSAPDCAEAFLLSADRMRYDSARRKFGVSVLSLLASAPKFDSESGILKLMSRYGPECVDGAMRLACAVGDADESAIDALENIIIENRPYRISDLKISGRELSLLGYSGAALGIELGRLLDAVIVGELNNDAAELISAAKEHAKLLN